MIAKPQHLDPPDERIIDGKLVHVYSAHPNGKRLIESLIWLCGHYHHVSVETTSEPDCSDAQTVLNCRALFNELDIDD